MNSRTLSALLLAALLPFGLWGRLALSSTAGIEAAGPGGAAPGWMGLLALSLSSVAVFGAFRLGTGTSGPAMAAALAFSTFPAVPDALAAAPARPLLFAAGGLALLLLLAGALPSIRREGRRRIAFLAPAALGALAWGLLSPGRDREGAEALFPPLLLAPLVAVLAGEVSLEVVRRPTLSPRLRGAALGLLALVLAGSGWAGFQNARSWASPAAFWERALREEPRHPAALGAAAAARAGAGDREGCATALRRFTEAVHGGGGAALGPRAADRGAAGAARAVGLLVEGGSPVEDWVAAAMEAARTLSPGNAVVLTLEGRTHLAAGRTAEALPLLERAVRVAPGSADAWDGLAQALLTGGQFGPGLEAARRATGLEPGRAPFIRTLARALLAVDRGAEALRVLKESLGPPPHDPAQARAFAEAHGTLARAEVSAGRPGRARRLLMAGLQVDPAYAPAQEHLAELDRAFAAERPVMEALVREDAEGNIDPNGITAFATWLCRWGQFEEAAPWFRALVEQRGGTGAVHYHLGLEFWEGRGTLEGYEKAVVSYRDALARDSSLVEARNRLWQALRTLGRLEEARAEARRFLEAARSHPDAYDAERFLEGGGPGR